MKNIKIIFGFVALLSVITSCDDWVDFDPHDEYQITDLDFLKSEADYQSMAVSCYTPTQWLNQMYILADVATNNATAGGESASDVGRLQELDDYTTTPSNTLMKDLWNVGYEGINRANYLITYKDQNPTGETIDFDGKDQMYGEVYFLRAYYYFSLVKMYGDLVVFTHRLTVSDFGNLQRSPKANAYAQIEQDLNTAIGLLSAVNEQNGRANKYAAQALLGKVLLYQNKFDEAASMLENVINGPYILVNDYDSMFLKEGENGAESIFEVQYSNGFPYYNWGGVTRGQGNYSVQQCGVRGLNGSSDMPYAPGWSTTLPTQDLYDAYETGDQRREATLFDMEAYKVNNPSLNISYQVAPYKNTGFYNKKYLPRKGQTSGQVELNYENNHRIIRLADVLLMAAEANNRASASNDAKAQEYLNRVRARAFGDDFHAISDSGDNLKQAIWKERRLELAMEGDRFFDLVRTGQAASELTGFVAGKNEVFPIPQDEIDISGLTQNPGW